MKVQSKMGQNKLINVNSIFRPKSTFVIEKLPRLAPFPRGYEIRHKKISPLFNFKFVKQSLKLILHQSAQTTFPHVSKCTFY